MSQIRDTLLEAGWIETTLENCRAGDEVLIITPHHIPRALTVTEPANKDGFVHTSDGTQRDIDTPVLSAPRISKTIVTENTMEATEKTYYAHRNNKPITDERLHRISREWWDRMELFHTSDGEPVPQVHHREICDVLDLVIEVKHLRNIIHQITSTQALEAAAEAYCAWQYQNYLELSRRVQKRRQGQVFDIIQTAIRAAEVDEDIHRQHDPKMRNNS